MEQPSREKTNENDDSIWNENVDEISNETVDEILNENVDEILNANAIETLIENDEANCEPTWRSPRAARSRLVSDVTTD